MMMLSFEWNRVLPVIVGVVLVVQSLAGPASSSSYEPPASYPRRVMFEEWGPSRETMDDEMNITHAARLERVGWRLLRSTGDNSFRMILDSSEPMVTAGYPGNTTAFNGLDSVTHLTQKSGAITERVYPSHGPQYIPHPDLDVVLHHRLRREIQDGVSVLEPGPFPCSLGRCSRVTKTEIIDKPVFGSTYESWPWRATGNERKTVVLLGTSTRFVSERKTTLNGTLIDELKVTCHDLPASERPCVDDFYFDEVVNRADPTAHWRLSETAGTFANSVPGGPSATTLGTVTRAVTGALGQAGDAAVSFESGSAEVVSSELDPASVTLEAWIKVEDVSLTRPLIERWTTEAALTSARSSSSDLALPLKGQGYGLRLGSGGVLTGFVLSSVGRVDVASPSSTVTPGTWTHVALSISASGRLVLFANGRVIGVAGSSFERGRGAAPFRIGATGGPSATSVQASGLVMDEVAVYSSVLPEFELFEHWTTGVGEAAY